MKARRALSRLDGATIVPSADWPPSARLPRNPNQEPGTRTQTTPTARKIFINEDLTRIRAHVEARARRLKRDNNKKITDTWNRDGYILVKKKMTRSTK